MPARATVLRAMSDFEQWLRRIGLERHVGLLLENELDFEVLPDLTDADLEGIGLPLGARKRLLRAIRERAGLATGAAAPTPQPVTDGEAERRQLTVMFCDLADSTALSEQLDPEDLRGLVAAYQSACNEVVSEFGGTVARYMGDGMLVYFGYPHAHEDDAARAILAGLEIVRAVSALRHWSGSVLAVRVGIATGLVVVGELIGEGASEERAALGVTPNLAARLQGLAAPNEVVVSDTARRLAGRGFEYRSLGPRRLKGLSEPVEAWSVIGVRAGQSRFDVRPGERQTRFVGRAQEVDLLLERWGQARDGEGQVVLVSGEAGIGKSRITVELRQRLAGEPHTSLRYQCSPYHANSALYPAIQQLEHAAGLGPEDSPQDRLDRLEALAAQGGTRDPQAVALLAALLSIPYSSRHPPLNLSPQAQRERMLEVLVDQFTGLCRVQPVLFVVEDAHWIDPTTQELITLIVGRLAELPALMVVTSRPEFAFPWGGFAHVTQLALNRMSRDQSRSIIDAVTAGRPVPGEAIEQIVARTDGVPLFIEELTAALIESGVLVAEAGGHRLARPVAQLSIPETLHASLLERLDRLAGAKNVAQVAATIGREFSFDLLRHVSPVQAEELPGRLEALVASGLVLQRGRPPAVTYAFKHALVRDAAYESQLRSTRRRCHEAIAAALQAHYPAVVENEPELIAHHLTEAERLREAAGFWLQAGRTSLHRAAVHEAVAHLTRGLHAIEALPEDPDRINVEMVLQTTLGAAYRAAKGTGHEELRRAYSRAYELSLRAQDPSQTLRILFGRFQFEWARSPSRGNEYAESLMREAQRQGKREGVLIAHCSLAMALWHLGESAAARTHAEMALDLYSPQEHGSLTVDYGIEFGVLACRYLGLSLFTLGYPDRALEVAQRSLSIASGNSPLVRCHALVSNWWTLMFRGELGAALEWAEEAVELGSRLRVPHFLAIATAQRGWAKARLGASGNAIESCREGVSGWQTCGFNTWLPFISLLLADSLAAQGRRDEAGEVIDAELERIAATGEHQAECPLLCVRADLLLDGGDAREAHAARLLDRTIGIARRQDARSWELRATTRLARLQSVRGESGEARRRLAEIHGWFEEGFDTADLAEATELLADLS